MAAGEDNLRYGTVATTLHWLLAVAILIMMGLGLTMTRLDETDPLMFPLFQLHKSIGLTILVLGVARVLWRLFHPAPPLPPHMPRWERTAARAVHSALYVLTIAIPLIGWATVSAAALAVPTMWFGLFEWPHVAVLAELPRAAKRMLEDSLATAHSVLAFSLLVLVALHAAAAFKHHFKDQDDVLKRMLPWTKLPT
jgi:cytochrome b561